MSLHDDIVSKAFQVGEFVVVEFLLVLSFKNLQCSLNMVVFNVMCGFACMIIGFIRVFQ